MIILFFFIKIIIFLIFLVCQWIKK